MTSTWDFVLMANWVILVFKKKSKEIHIRTHKVHYIYKLHMDAT